MEAARRPSPFVPLLLAWLVPGAGHFAIGRKWPGIFFALAILPLFGVGLVLAGFENVSVARHQFLFILQVLAGLPAIAAEFLTRGSTLTEPLTDRTAGDLYTCVAGLLNLVAMADVWARCAEGDPEERLAKKMREDDALLVRPETPVPPAAPPAMPSSLVAAPPVASGDESPPGGELG